MTLRVKTSGFRELDQALGKLPPAVARAVLNRTAKDALTPFVETAKRLVPVDEGAVRDSIAVGRGQSKSAKRNNPVPRMNRADGVRWWAGPASKTIGIKYASFVEFGTVDTPAQAYMRPAWDRESQPMLDRIKVTLGAEIDLAAQRAARRARRQR